MKRNDMERLNRELRRQQKQEDRADKLLAGAGDVKTYANILFDMLHYDSDCIYNTREDEDLLELMIGMKEDLPENKWDLVIRKAVRMTKVKDKEMAFTELRAALDC